MANDLKFYVVLKTTDELLRAYGKDDPRTQSTEDRQNEFQRVQEYIANVAGIEANFKVVSLPSKEVGAVGADRTGLDPKNPPEELVCSLSFENPDKLSAFAEAMKTREGAFSGGGADIPFAGTDHWCPSDATDPIFADRTAAERLLGIDFLKSQSGTTGRDVNVVVVDQGLDRTVLGSNYEKGWPVGNIQPGTTKRQPGTIRRPHGMMIANNVVEVVPEVKLFDLPVAPWKITNIPAFLSLADAAFRVMRADIAKYKASGERPGPWILVNPWGIFDTTTDLAPPNDYIRNPNHPFNKLIADVVSDGIDVVFAAGNCGQFCPDNRCGARNKGPGNSIFGANSHPKVLTVGAVRSDGMWLGYSSQGPGQSALDPSPPPNAAHDKPDLCASSQFCESSDAFSINTGTSASCAIATGVVAALRSKWYSASSRPPLPPSALKQLLIITARKSQGPKWNNRLGHGILDARAAYNNLP